MRKSCYDCVIKHLGSAAVFIKEFKLGYSSYDIWVIGELEHASDECLEENIDLARVIREHRLAWTDDHNHMIPFEDLNLYIKDCILADNSGIKTPAIPESITVGLDKDGNGNLAVHGDTRP